MHPFLPTVDTLWLRESDSLIGNASDYSPTVVDVNKANSSGQITPGGIVDSIEQFESAPFLVHLSLKNGNVESPDGTVGTAAIYTDQFTGLSHVFRKVFLHQQNWKNYLQI